MKRRHLICLLLSAAMPALLFFGATRALAQKGGGKIPPPSTVSPYRFTDIGQPVYANSGGQKSYDVTEPDEFGELLIVGGGIASPSPDFVAVWNASAAGVIGAAPVPNSRRGSAAINEAGMIACYGYSAAKDAFVGIVEVPGAATVEFPKSGFRPQAMNNFGDVVLTQPAWGSYLWTVDKDGTTSAPIFLKDFFAYDINDFGVMAGQQRSTTAAAIAWFDAGVLQIQALPGLNTTKGLATGINNLGEVVGFSSPSPLFSGLPFLWSATDGLVALNPNKQVGAAMDINDRGQIVGWSTGSGHWYAWLWEDGKFSNLNVLSGVGTSSFGLETAEAINEAGQIVGRSSKYNKKGLPAGHQTYLLTPKP